MNRAHYQFAALMAVYSLVWLPIVYAYTWLTVTGNDDPNDHKVAPPRFVWVSIFIVFLLFLLFPGAYAKNLARDLPRTVTDLVDREKFYVLASMIAKVSLHASLDSRLSASPPLWTRLRWERTAP